jgi:hypothetical protein
LPLEFDRHVPGHAAGWRLLSAKKAIDDKHTHAGIQTFGFP